MIARLTLTVLAGAFLTASAQQPDSGRAAQRSQIPRRTQKPPLHAEHWLAITGKPLSATAGALIFAKGGNAVDATAAMLAAGCTMWDTLSCGGETQALIYNPKTKKVVGIDALGIAPAQVRFELGSTDMPENPASTGSVTAASTGSAVHDVATALRQKLVQLAIADPQSPLHGVSEDAVRTLDGRLTTGGDRGETYVALLARQGGQPVEATISTRPGAETQQYSMHSFGAVFTEVWVDPDLAIIRVPRVVTAHAVGRILNAKTARSQIIGGVVWGVGMALEEETLIDPRSGRYINADLAEYHVPVNADIGTIDVAFIEEPDLHVSSVGAKGIGEIGITGVAASIANAVYHATGKRVRELPIRIERVLS